MSIYQLKMINKIQFKTGKAINLYKKTLKCKKSKWINRKREKIHKMHTKK